MAHSSPNSDSNKGTPVYKSSDEVRKSGIRAKHRNPFINNTSGRDKRTINDINDTSGRDKRTINDINDISRSSSSESLRRSRPKVSKPGNESLKLCQLSPSTYSGIPFKTQRYQTSASQYYNSEYDRGVSSKNLEVRKSFGIGDVKCLRRDDGKYLDNTQKYLKNVSKYSKDIKKYPKLDDRYSKVSGGYFKDDTPSAPLGDNKVGSRSNGRKQDVNKDLPDHLVTKWYGKPEFVDSYAKEFKTLRAEAKKLATEEFEISITISNTRFGISNLDRDLENYCNEQRIISDRLKEIDASMSSTTLSKQSE